MNWRAIGNAPGLCGPTESCGLDAAPYIARLLASDEFRSEVTGDLWRMVLAAIDSGDVTDLRAAIRREAETRLSDYIDHRANHWQSEGNAADDYCRLYEKYDEARRAREAA